MIEVWTREENGAEELFLRAFDSEEEARRYVARHANEMLLPRNKKGQFISPYSIIKG